MLALGASPMRLVLQSPSYSAAASLAVLFSVPSLLVHPGFSSTWDVVVIKKDEFLKLGLSPCSHVFTATCDSM